MRPSTLQRLPKVALAACLLATQAAGPALAAPAPRASLQGITDKVEAVGKRVAERLFRATRGALEAIAARASRSERVALRVEMAYLDHANRIFFDLQGLARVRVPGDRWLESIRAAKDAGRTWTMASNGPVSVDIAVTPLEVEGREVKFALQLDVSILVNDIFQELARAGAGAAGALAVGALASQAADAVAALRADVAGDALVTGVQDLSGMLSGEAGASAYAHREDLGIDPAAFVGSQVTGTSVLRHFVVAALTAGAAMGARVVGSSAGAALAGLLLPTGGSFVAVALATTAAFWFGSWVVHQVTVRLPILWKLGKIGRLHRKALAASGADREARLRRLGDYTEGVVERLVREMDRTTRRWTFFELMTEYLREHLQEEGFVLEPYRPLIDAARRVLQQRMVHDRDWYAARMYYQLLGTIDELPHGKPSRPDRG